MIANCPACDARFRLSKEKFGGQQVTLKCVQCQKNFQVDVPPVAAAGCGRIHVLIAHCDASLCDMIREVVDQADISSEICHDGETALQMMDARPPHVAIVDVALPGLYAFEVVEKIRSRNGLADVKIILLSSVYNKMAYKRTPASLYGADDYIEKHHVPNDLVSTVHRLVTEAHLPVNGEIIPADEEVVVSTLQSAAEEKAVMDFTDAMNQKIEQAEEQETSAELSGERVDKAHRLARNIVLDIALYNQDKVETGVKDGSFFDLLKDEIAEGRLLFNERFAPETMNGRDILQIEFEEFVEKRRAELS